MGLTNPLHLMIVLAIALLVLGPKRLPEVAKSVGQGIKEFKGSIAGHDDHELNFTPVTETTPVHKDAVEA
jgi:sec-independent protein translocase protein TatA